MTSSRSTLRGPIILLGIMAAGAILKLGHNVLVPLMVAFFLMLLLHPVVLRTAAATDRLFAKLKGKFGRDHKSEVSGLAVAFSVIFVLLLFLALFFGLYMMVRGQVVMILGKSSQIMSRVVEPIREWLIESNLFGDAEAVNQHFNTLVEQALSVVPSAAGPIISNVFTMIMILFLTMFLLMGRTKLELKIRKNLGEETFASLDSVLHKIGFSTRKFLFTKLITSIITGVSIGLILLLFLTPQDALIWGMICFVMNFIPFWGSMISGAAAILYTLAAHREGLPVSPWFSAVGIVAVNNIVSNAIEPRLMQFNLPLGSATVLLSVIVWSWLWGPWGMLLAVPISIMLKVLVEASYGKGWVSVLMEI